MPVHKLSILLNRPRKIYYQGEHLSGLIVLENKHELRHDGVTLSVQGFADIRYNPRAISFIDTFYGSNKSIPLTNYTQEICCSGKFAPGRVEIPFQLLLEPIEDRTTLYETYHGVFISIQYCLKCCIKRPLLSKDLIEFTEFSIEYDADPIGAPPLVKQPVKFEITPNSLSALRPDIIPNFKITGQLESSVFRLTEPITGEFLIEKCEATIRSVELQLVRLETCGTTPGDRDFSSDATEVQNIQIGDGNLLRNVSIPIHMVLPRLFTCPTLITSNFRIEFEINLVIILDDNHLITENFPVKLIRSTIQPIDF